MWIIFVLLFTSAASRVEHKENLTIGGLFEEDAGFMRHAFIYATEWINENNVLAQFNLVPEVQDVDPFDNFIVSQRVCEMLGVGVAGVFGPRSVDTSDHVQSICDAMEIPHVELRWDSRQRRGSCLVNLFPHPSTMSKVFVDIVRMYEWESFTVIYEDNDGLIRLNGLLTYYDYKGFPVTVRQLDEGGNYRPTMRRIKNTNEKNIVLDCSANILFDVLLHAQQVGLMGVEYSYIITSLDFQTIDLEPFMHAGTNITGVRFFDPESNEVQEMMGFWRSKEKEHGYEINDEVLLAETALIHDAVMLYTKAVDQLLKSLEIQPRPLSCDNNQNWEHGYSIINYMKVTEITGLTGLIKFDHEGFRTDFKLDIIELTAEGIMKKGTWNTTEGVNFTQSFDTESEENAKKDLRNVTFVVMISLVDPHAMLKETTTKLDGNDKYEGMGIDVIHELSLMNGFNYTFREQEDGNSGNPDKVTGKWNGMLGKVINKEADLALEMRGLDALQFQLWAKTAREEAPYPLVGHERPFAIKLSCLRDGLSSEEGFDLDHCNNVHDPLARCHFILRSTAKSCEGEVKKSCKKAGGRMRIGHVFRRSLSKESSGCLFGHPLPKICEGDSLPRPVMSMLQQLLAKGPFTQGIFRKSANARLVRELRDKLDAGEAVTWDHVPVLVTAALFKDFLRSLPDPLLTSALYPQWRDAVDTPNTHHKLLKIKGILSQLPKTNHSLLCHFLCVLHHISRRAPHNLMSPSNLGVCVGPSLLWSDACSAAEDLRAVPALVECLVSHCQVLCGTHVVHLLGDPRDSGTEESDSMRRDDSSIDSLECSPPPRKDKISLSRDSGLTMSDSQLYTPDEEESGSTSSSGYDPAFDNHAKVTSTLSGPAEYVRVYGGWEERLNPNFQRQAWFRQRSRRLSSVPNHSKTEEAVRRSASEESLLDTPPPPTPPRRNKPDLNHSPRKSCEPIKCSEMNGKCSDIITNNRSDYKNEVTGKSSPKEPLLYPEDKFGRHPPLRKVTAVHCEVVMDQNPRSRYKENSHSPIYGVNGVKKLSLSSAELNFSPAKSAELSFVSARSGDGTYSPQRIQEIYSPVKSDQSFPRSLEHSYSSSSLLNHSQRSADSTTISDQSTYSSPKVGDKVVLGFGAGDYYYAVKENEEVQGSECDDSSTLSDDDCTPHVSRSNSRGNEVTTKLRHLPPVHVETCFVRGRLKRKEERAAHRSRSLPPPPPYRPPPPATPATQNRRAPITSYYLGDCSQSQRYIVTRTFMDEESYV